ncbi:hypothetical protein CPC08DRAFT_745810 [Agrocybe pediades]|nr:hypothetical protein CPC08DRAFT_745810 [Agrocybe pediades]
MSHVLTGTHLLCFYPELYARNISILQETDISSHAALVAQLHERGISAESTSDWNEPCGNVCPEYWRRSEGLKGVAITRWTTGVVSPTKERSAEEELGPCNCKWKWDKICENHNCPNRIHNV